MKKIIVVINLILIACVSCNKNKTSTPETPDTTQNNQQTNHYSFKIGATSFSTNNLYGQVIIGLNDTMLMINEGVTADTITGGFTLNATSTGTFNHDSTNTSPTNRFVVNFGNDPTSSPHATFFSKSGTVNITAYDKINNTFSGTFSAIMYLSSNPSYTLPLTNGSFYLHY